MKIYDVQQGSDAWKTIRLGIPTASRFDEILTPSTRKLSKSSGKYACELLAGLLLGESLDSASSGYMERGTAMEAEAASWYEFTRGVEAKTIGFVTLDDGSAGCSPDRCVGDDGLLEIKCPGAVVHLQNLLSMTEQYACQVQGQLWICERKWCDLLTYHPTLPSACVRIERDEEFIAALAGAVEMFTETMDDHRTQLQKLGCIFPAKKIAQAA